MRIWYQGLIPLSPQSFDYYESMRTHAASVTRMGAEVEFHGMPAQIYPQGYGPAEFTRLLAGEWVEVCAFAGMVLEAERAGFDAVIIGTLQEPGLQLARTLTDLPVVGYGQAVTLFARCLGDKLGVLAFNRPLFPLFRERLDSHIQNFVGPIQDLDVTYDELHGGFGGGVDSVRLRAAIVEGCERLIKDGASVIIPGQMLLAELTWKLGIQRVGDTPVLDALGSLVLLSESLAILRETSGVSVSRTGFKWNKADDAVRESLAMLSAAAGVRYP